MIEINKIKPGTIIKATMTGQPNKINSFKSLSTSTIL